MKIIDTRENLELDDVEFFHLAQGFQIELAGTNAEGDPVFSVDSSTLDPILETKKPRS